jgi:hypothetical protein
VPEAKTTEDQNMVADLFERVVLCIDKGGAERDNIFRTHRRGLFTADPESDGFDTKNVIVMERRPIRAGVQVLKFVADRKPTYAGIDPYNYYIDRNSGDNVASIAGKM